MLRAVKLFFFFFRLFSACFKGSNLRKVSVWVAVCVRLAAQQGMKAASSRDGPGCPIGSDPKSCLEFPFVRPRLPKTGTLKKTGFSRAPTKSIRTLEIQYFDSCRTCCQSSLEGGSWLRWEMLGITRCGCPFRDGKPPKVLVSRPCSYFLRRKTLLRSWPRQGSTLGKS